MPFKWCDRNQTTFCGLPAVSPDDTFETYVRELVSAGRYNHASEVIREARRLKTQQDEERAAQLDALRRGS